MCTVRKLLGILFLVCLVPQVGVGQNQAESEVLTNADVVEMINAGLSAEIVLAKLESCGCRFTTSSSALVALLRSGVPEEVIYAMVVPSIRGPQPPDPEPEATTPAVLEDGSDVVVGQASPAPDITFSGGIKYLGGRGFPDFRAVRNSWNNSLTITNNEITFGFRNNLIPSETIPISVPVIGVNLMEDRAKVLAAIRRYSIRFPVAPDPDGRVGRLYSVHQAPSIFLIDSNGRVSAPEFLKPLGC